VFIDIFCTYFL